MIRGERKPVDMNRPSSEDFLRAKQFTDMVKRSKYLSPQQKQKLWWRAVHGDIGGAAQEYEDIMRGILT